MFDNNIQKRIWEVARELCKINGKLPSINAVITCMFEEPLSVYNLHVEKDTSVLRNTFDLVITKDEDEEEVVEETADYQDIDEISFLKDFVANVPYGIFVDTDNIGHYIYDKGFIQIFKNYVYVWTSDRASAEQFLPYIKRYESKVVEEKIAEYRLVVCGRQGFDTINCTTHRNVDINIEKNYNDDFPYKEYKDFCEKDGSGLALMYGSPGTGKTTAIKKLIYDCEDTRFLIMDFSMLQNIVSGDFVQFLLSLKNTVIVMEDCEHILRRRDLGSNPLINSLLNITDGLIGDSLNIRFLCTFNAALTDIDEALLRPGRLKLKYEFKPLCANKTKELCGDNKAETLAEIYNREKNVYGEQKPTRIGF